MAEIGFYGTAVEYPDGRPARNEAINIYHEGTTDPVDLFLNLLGTIPRDNPVSTNSLGELEFYAEQGEYDLEIRGFRTRILVQDVDGEGGDPVISTGIEHIQSTPSASWSIDVPEELNRTPNVQVYIDGQFVLTDVYADANTVNVHLPFPMTGSAVLS